MCVCMSTDLIVNNKGGANLKERWMARAMSTDFFLSALLSKDCGKGKEVSVREKLEEEEEERGLPPEVLEKWNFCFCFAVCLSMCKNKKTWFSKSTRTAPLKDITDIGMNWLASSALMHFSSSPWVDFELKWEDTVMAAAAANSPERQMERLSRLLQYARMSAQLRRCLS